MLILPTTYFKQLQSTYRKQRQFKFEKHYLILNLSWIVYVVHGTQLIENEIYKQGSSTTWAIEVI